MPLKRGIACGHRGYISQKGKNGAPDIIGHPRPRTLALGSGILVLNPPLVLQFPLNPLAELDL